MTDQHPNPDVPEETPDTPDEEIVEGQVVDQRRHEVEDGSGQPAVQRGYAEDFDGVDEHREAPDEATNMGAPNESGQAGPTQ
jgi:hypothetical protein